MDKLDKYVEELRQSKGDGIPTFSPHDGRTEAKVLFLLQDPGKSGASQTDVADRGNPGSTAKNFEKANTAADLDRELTISWNAVPWPLPDDSTFVKELEKVREEGWLKKLLDLLPNLRVVVLLGGEAHRLTPDLYEESYSKLHVLHGPHPSWSGVSTTVRRKWLENTVLKARNLVA